MILCLLERGKKKKKCFHKMETIMPFRIVIPRNLFLLIRQLPQGLFKCPSCVILVKGTLNSLEQLLIVLYSYWFTVLDNVVFGTTLAPISMRIISIFCNIQFRLVNEMLSS